MKTKNFQDIFLKLVDAHTELDDDEFATYKDVLETSGRLLRVEVDDELDWEESVSEDYEECPLVIQTFTVFLGEEKIYEGVRMFGSELVDPTHTGLGGRWEAIQVDGGDEDSVCSALEELGHEVDWPLVPAWR
jgi:hypothetical protein